LQTCKMKILLFTSHGCDSDTGSASRGRMIAI
jgi:hypothetical protein